jgi:hypothetical protein
MQLTQEILDTLRANSATQQQLLSEIEPTPDPNPLQAPLDAALAQIQLLAAQNAAFVAKIESARLAAQGTLDALNAVGP